MDEGDFRVLVDEHFADLWRFARRRCPSAADADDVVSEALAAAWRRRHDLPDGRDARLWLFGTARHVLANQRRSTGRRRRLDRRLEVTAPTLTPVPDPADVVAQRHDTPLAAALASLAEDDRDLLLMRAWDGLAVTDIAALLDVTPNAGSVRLTKARARLATALGRTDPPPSRTGRQQTPSLEGGEHRDRP